MTAPVLVEWHGPVLVITLNRPQVRNAVNGAMAHAIAETIDLLEAEPGLRAAVLTGAGGTFCAGNDLKALLAGESERTLTARGFAGITAVPPRKPVVAAVEGHAVGGGFEIALACDLIVAGRSACFAVPEVKRGLVAGGGAILRLPTRLPRGLALELLLTGDPLDAATAFQYGLVNRLVEDGEALAAALDLAERIAANSPVAVVATKEILDASADWPQREFFDRQRPVLRRVMRSADAREGAAAFLERRAPRWPDSA